MLEINNSETNEIKNENSEFNNYCEIKPEGNMTPEECLNFWHDFFNSEIINEGNNTNLNNDVIDTNFDIKENLNGRDLNDIKETYYSSYEEIRVKTVRLPKNGGEWSGERGNSEWKPNMDIEPGDRNGTNPQQKTWNQIMEQYKFDSISFNEGEPDFSEIAKGGVEIDDFTDDRSLNFDQADEKLAEQKGCTPEEVAKWRSENKYTWHECRDCRTMQKVPTEVHGNIPHSGGISEYKSQKNEI